MKIRYLWPILLVGGLLFVLPALAQCPSCPSCSSGVPSGSVVFFDRGYTWVPIPETPDQEALLLDGHQVGVWSYKIGKYYTVGDWKETPLPQGVPGLPPGPTVEVKRPLTGVVPEKRGEPGTSINGTQVAPVVAFQALESSLPDDSGKCRITVICADKTTRDGIMAFFKADPNSSKFELQDIDPTAVKESWMLECGFKKPTDPKGVVVYAQAPNGKVLWREDSWNPVHITMGLRKTDPNYDPNKDPDLNPKVVPPTPPAPDVSPEPDQQGFSLSTKEILIGGGVVAGFLFLRKKKVS